MSDTLLTRQDQSDGAEEPGSIDPIGRSELERAIERFSEDVANAGSARSASTYRAALGRFVAYLEERARLARQAAEKASGIPRTKRARKGAEAITSPSSDPSDRTLLSLSRLTVEDAVGFTRWLEGYMERERGRAPSQATVFTYTSALQSFYSYLYREEIRTDIDLESLRQRLRKLRGRRERSLPRVPDDDVVEALCRVAAVAAEDPGLRSELIRKRDISLMETLRSSGMRVSEAVSLRREHINLTDKSAIVRGKGGKDRVVFFSSSAIAALRDYWEERQDETVSRHTGSLPVFARHNGQAKGKVVPLSTQGVRYIIEQLRKRAGAEWPVTPHRLRAWFATHLLDSEVNLAEVQDLLGHESANTTRIYTKVRPRRLQEAHRQAFE